MRLRGIHRFLALGVGILLLAGCSPDGDSAEFMQEVRGLAATLHTIPGVVTGGVDSTGEIALVDITVKLESDLSRAEQVAAAVKVRRAIAAVPRFDRHHLTLFFDDATTNPSGTFIRWVPETEPLDEPQFLNDLRLWQEFIAIAPAEYLFFDARDNRHLTVRQLLMAGEPVADPETLGDVYSVPWAQSGGDATAFDFTVEP